EKNKNEIEMNDLDRKEFIDLLHVVYSTGKKITNDSVEYLLKLGDRYQIACVIDRAEEFLFASDDVSNMEKMRIADENNL
ncbi:hypothetical protein PMAYCL1PPCAC_24891, partial [Pristionchus mayeri]